MIMFATALEPYLISHLQRTRVVARDRYEMAMTVHVAWRNDVDHDGLTRLKLSKRVQDMLMITGILRENVLADSCALELFSTS